VLLCWEMRSLLCVGIFVLVVRLLVVCWGGVGWGVLLRSVVICEHVKDWVGGQGLRVVEVVVCN
jgi:hypothetical protein